MSFLKEIKSWLGHDPESITPVDQVSRQDPLFVYVKMPGDLDSLDRWEKFAQPLQHLLEADSLGTVTGGGSQSTEDDEGDDVVEFCGIDVDLYDAVNGLVLLRRELVRLQAPPGTVLLYELEGHEWEEPVHRAES